MADYIAGLLTANEKILFETRLSWVLFVKYGIMAIFVTAGVATILITLATPPWIVIAAILACLAGGAALPWFTFKCTEFAVTTRRVIMKSGIISRNVFEMRLQKIESIDLVQSIGGRFLNYGTVVVHGTGDTAKKFEMITSPVNFRKVLDQAAEDARAARSPS